MSKTIDCMQCKERRATIRLSITASRIPKIQRIGEPLILRFCEECARYWSEELSDAAEALRIRSGDLLLKSLGIISDLARDARERVAPEDAKG